jgi:predicted O-methyltransferase YrrM
MLKHADRYLELSELGKPMPYLPTHEFNGDHLNDRHASYSTCPMGAMGIEACIDIGIEGYLQRADALKIYELAYFSDGDVLELGTHKGLSTSIISSALTENTEADDARVLETVDIDKAFSKVARKNNANTPGQKGIQYHVMDAAAMMDKMIKAERKFGFIFVDHWHGYDATKDAAVRVDKLLKPGGFVLFHDYNDPSNADPKHVYGVYQAVEEVIVKSGQYEFCGNYGCCGLFQMK